MTLELRLRPEAELDLADAALWYEEQGQGLGREGCRGAAQMVLFGWR
jgi:hypothetical protein